MSAILASIADAETYARREFEYGFEETSERVAKTATAARAEHADLIAFVRRVSREDQNADEHNAARVIDALGREARTLLSRVGGGS